MILSHWSQFCSVIIPIIHKMHFQFLVGNFLPVMVPYHRYQVGHNFDDLFGGFRSCFKLEPFVFHVRIRTLLQRFRGVIEQKVPSYQPIHTSKRDSHSKRLLPYRHISMSLPPCPKYPPSATTAVPVRTIPDRLPYYCHP